MKLEELLSKHLWGCAVGWGTKEQQSNREYEEKYCNCGILEARKEYENLFVDYETVKCYFSDCTNDAEYEGWYEVKDPLTLKATGRIVQNI